MAKNKKDFKRCPRCDRKQPITQPKCPGCDLIFARLSKATNKAAKKAIRRGEKNKVICDSVLPRDVSKWKLFWLCMPIIGLFGVHRFYVGKYKSATFYLIAAILVLVAAAFPLEWWGDFWLASLIVAMITPVGFTLTFWVVDIFRILFNNFRVPISIEENLMPGEGDYREVLDIVDTINKKVSKQQKSNKKEIQKTLKEIDKKLEENEKDK